MMMNTKNQVRIVTHKQKIISEKKRSANQSPRILTIDVVRPTLYRVCLS